MNQRKCKQCGNIMNPVEVMLGDICGWCVRKNHLDVIDPGRKYQEAKNCSRKIIII